MKILILGTNGMIGHQLWYHLNQEFPGKVYGTVRKDWNHYSQFELFKKENLLFNLDATTFSDFQKALDQLHPDIVLNCIGITLRKPEINDVAMTLEVNAMFPHRLHYWCQKNNAKLIHFSTDCVFDGQSGEYTEYSSPTAKDTYGKTKFLGEVTAGNSLTLRTPVVGREIEGKTELFEWFLKHSDTTVKGYSNVFYSGTTTINLAKEVKRIIKGHFDLHGLYQISGPNISKFDLLGLLNQQYKKNVTIEKLDSVRSNKTLVCEKYKKETGYIVPTWPEMISEMFDLKNIKYKD